MGHGVVMEMLAQTRACSRDFRNIKMGLLQNVEDGKRSIRRIRILS